MYNTRAKKAWWEELADSGVLAVGWYVLFFVVSLGIAITVICATFYPAAGAATTQTYITGLPATVNLKIKPSFTDVIYDRPGLLQGGAAGVGIPQIGEWNREELLQELATQPTIYGIVSQKEESRSLLINYYAVDFPVVHSLNSPLLLGEAPEGNFWGGYSMYNRPDNHARLENDQIVVPFVFTINLWPLGVPIAAIVVGLMAAYLLQPPHLR